MIFLFNWFLCYNSPGPHFCNPIIMGYYNANKEIKEGVFCHPIALCEIKFHIQSAGKSF